MWKVKGSGWRAEGLGLALLGWGLGCAGLGAALLFAGLNDPVALAGSRPMVGEPARLFVLPAINETAARDMTNQNRISLGDIAGPLAPYPSKAVVLYFFDDRALEGDLLALSRVQKRFARDNVKVIAICGDKADLGTLATWLERLKLNFPVLRDNHGIVAQRYDLPRSPMIFVLDGSGVIQAIGAATGTALEPDLILQVQAVLTP